MQKLSADKHSCLTSIRIGWRLPRFALGPILQTVVPALLQRPADVKYLQLILDSWVPAHTFKRLISWPSLKTVDIRATKIRTRAMSDPRHDRLSPKSQVFQPPDDSVLRMLPHLSQSVVDLKLVDCDIRPDDIADIMKMLRRRPQIAALSLRHNRKLDHTVAELFSLPFLKSLDISLCDLEPHDGYFIAAALKKNNTLEKLSVAGNYRMALAVPKIVQKAAPRLLEFDCSFCHVQNKFQKQVFDLLAQEPHSKLRVLRMQSARIKDATALVNCINNNKSIQSLILDHPRDPFPPADSELEKIRDAIKDSYHIGLLRVDMMPAQLHFMEDMAFWLTLNRCGRSILLHDNDAIKSTVPWSTVLQRAVLEGDREIIYWLLRNGAEQF